MKRAGLVLSILVLLVAASGLVGQAAESVLRVRLANEIVNLDYANSQSVSDTVVLYQVMEGLVEMDWTSSEMPIPIRGRLAKSYEISEDGKEILFTIYEGIKFQRGYGELTAEDVAYSMKRIMDPAVKSRIATYYAAVASIDVVGPYQVKVTLKDSSALTFIQALTWNGASYITSKKAVEELGADFNRRPIGTGPYQFVSWSPGTGVYLEAFDEYWGAPAWGFGKPGYDKIEMLLIADDMIALDALETGELDVVGLVGKGSVERAQQMKDITLSHAASGSWQHMVSFNVKRPAISDVRVRQALAYALDLKTIAERLGPMEKYWPCPFNPFVFSATDEFWKYDYNPAKAKELLAEAGYPNGFTLKLIYPAVYLWGDVALETGHYWEQIGIDVDFEVIEYSLYATVRRDGNWDASVASQTVFSPYLYAELYMTTAFRNYTGYGTPELDALILRAAATPDEAQAEVLWREFQQIVTNDLPYIWGPAQVAWFAISNHVAGVIPVAFSTLVNLAAAHPAP
ncbi:MAG: ABC transporter substrate-binding protein [Candidatus Bipolaricaulota bacterium]|nr:ABC transporter substrate-binding protein [Candidatus Bipolaricaulota bacterium]